jgi:transcriptional regulatory protein RtcR
MATLAQGGRISDEIVEEEIQRLKATWTSLEEQTRSEEFLSQILSAKALGEIDLFDRVQLAHVIQVCRDSRSMSEAGRQLFDVSRTRKTSTNDADRLRKYLGRFGIDWNQIVES